MEIQAFAELYQTEVHMFQVHDSRNFRKTFVMRGSSPSVRQSSVRCILYPGGYADFYSPGHFDWLEPIDPPEIDESSQLKVHDVDIDGS